MAVLLLFLAGKALIGIETKSEMNSLGKDHASAPCSEATFKLLISSRSMNTDKKPQRAASCSSDPADSRPTDGERQSSATSDGGSPFYRTRRVGLRGSGRCWGWTHWKAKVLP